jgi:hypothetical protein
MNLRPPTVVLLSALVAVAGHTLRAGQTPPRARDPVGEASEARRPKDDAELRSWLQNMVWHHRYSIDEIRAATGLTAREVAEALKRFGITPATRPKRPAGSKLLVLPYPGGRHPRLGFFEGAVRPQREAKVSVFPPWDEGGYVVVDLPEAVWSNLGLTYLAHTHIPTIWDRKGVRMERLEWGRRDGGTLDLERRLPNGVAFRARVVPTPRLVRLELSLTNGTKERLTDLRVQVCVLLGRAAGFERQADDNKVFARPYAACRSADGKRWVITSWEQSHRTWGNARCPCLHADPQFPDLGPGQTRTLRGVLAFYEGDDVRGEFRRLEKAGWRGEPGKPRAR